MHGFLIYLKLDISVYLCSIYETYVEIKSLLMQIDQIYILSVFLFQTANGYILFFEIPSARDKYLYEPMYPK